MHCGPGRMRRQTNDRDFTKNYAPRGRTGPAVFKMVDDISCQGIKKMSLKEIAELVQNAKRSILTKNSAGAMSALGAATDEIARMRDVDATYWNNFFKAKHDDAGI